LRNSITEDCNKLQNGPQNGITKFKLANLAELD